MHDLRDQPDVDELARIAAQLVARVRDVEPDANARWLASELPNPGDWWRLCFVLAAAVPDGAPWRDLTAWTQQPATLRLVGEPAEPARKQRRTALNPKPADPTGKLQPCGTPAAARRHLYHREPLCAPCREAERIRERSRSRNRRRAAA